MTKSNLKGLQQAMMSWRRLASLCPGITRGRGSWGCCLGLTCKTQALSVSHHEIVFYQRIVKSKKNYEYSTRKRWPEGESCFFFVSNLILTMKNFTLSCSSFTTKLPPPNSWDLSEPMFSNVGLFHCLKMLIVWRGHSNQWQIQGAVLTGAIQNV